MLWWTLAASAQTLDVSALSATNQVTLQISGAPDGMVGILASRTGPGPGPCPARPDVACANVTSPIATFIGQVAGGTATLQVTVPGAGNVIWFQAIGAPGLEPWASGVVRRTRGYACDAYPNAPDGDGDGTCDLEDVCWGSDDTQDTDADSICDGIDVCDGPSGRDTDGDGICEPFDRCWGQPDADDDGVCDAFDTCDGWFDDRDSDTDGILDCDQAPPVDGLIPSQLFRTLVLRTSWPTDQGGAVACGDVFADTSSLGAGVSCAWTPDALTVTLGANATVQVGSTLDVLPGAWSSLHGTPTAGGPVQVLPLTDGIAPVVSVNGPSSVAGQPGQDVVLTATALRLGGRPPSAIEWTVDGARSPALQQALDASADTDVLVVPADLLQPGSRTFSSTWTNAVGTPGTGLAVVEVTVPGDLHVFVSSVDAPDGALGDRATRDAACQTLADAASLPGTFVSWTGSPGEDLGATLASLGVAGQAIVRTDGVEVASGLADLLDGSLLAPIDHTEWGDPRNATVFTGLYFNGQGAPEDCGGWSSTAFSATGGVSSSTSIDWSSGPSLSCSQPAARYCIEIP
ncbi:MAG: hypothetical protein H6735_14610 [Alphaproteobacteria bacterium]|nr:hypothetical protein [Alphaproteobacteria bacterium]